MMPPFLDDDEDDPLRPAKGIIMAIAIMLVVFVAGVVAVFLAAEFG